MVRQHRSTQRRRPSIVPADEHLRKRLRALSGEHQKWGYRKQHTLLCREGLRINRKRVRRIWREEGLQVRRRKRPDPDEGRHGLASQMRVPLFQLRISEGLWLMNKAALLQLEHFNKSNALSWALTMGLFAIPVIYSEREWRHHEHQPLSRLIFATSCPFGPSATAGLFSPPLGALGSKNCW